jgi:energy-coupling factor transporter transmembrane protein EcfT
MGWAIIFGLSFTIQGVFALVPILMGTVFAGVFGVASFLLLQMATVALTFVASFALGPLEGILTAVVYFNQREAKEGFDLEMAADKLTDAPLSVHYDV